MRRTPSHQGDHRELPTIDRSPGRPVDQLDPGRSPAYGVAPRYTTVPRHEVPAGDQVDPPDSVVPTPMVEAIGLHPGLTDRASRSAASDPASRRRHDRGPSAPIEVKLLRLEALAGPSPTSRAMSR